MPKRFHVLLVSSADWSSALETAAKETSDEFFCDDIVDPNRLSDSLRRHFYDAVVVAIDARAGAAPIELALAQRPDIAFIVVMPDEGYERMELALAMGVQEVIALEELNARSLERAIRQGCLRQGLQVQQRRAAVERRQLFQKHPFAWLVADANTLRITEANPAAALLYGDVAGALMSRTLLDLTNQGDREVLLDALRQSPATGCMRELTQLRIDGSPIKVAIFLQATDLARRPVVMTLARDITVRERAIAALERSERRFRDIFQYSLGLLCTHDLHGVILSVNPAAAAALGYEVSQLLGRRFPDFMPERHHEPFAQYLERVVALGEDEGVFRLFASDGQSRLWEYRNVLEEDEHGEKIVFGHAQDITHRVIQERELKEEARRDPLTGCWNRRALEQFERRLAEGPWSVIVIDLDGFKQINDTQGHVAGDRILAAVGIYLQRLCGKQAQVFRTGGDEFLIVVPGGSEQARTLEAALAKPEVDMPAAFSLGIAAREGKERMIDTIDRADAALYEQRRLDRSDVPRSRQ